MGSGEQATASEVSLEPGGKSRETTCRLSAPADQVCAANCSSSADNTLESNQGTESTVPSSAAHIKLIAKAGYSCAGVSDHDKSTGWSAQCWLVVGVVSSLGVLVAFRCMCSNSR